MKRFYFVLTAFIMLSVSAWAQTTLTDVTSTYLKNADFSQGPAVTEGHIYGYKADFEATDKGNNVGAYWLQNVTGWSIKQSNADGVGGAVFTYGTSDAHQLKGNNVGAPATGPDDTAGQALGFFAVWTNSAYYYQSVFLPAGNYKITYRIYNQSGTSAPTASFFGFIPDSGTPSVVAPADLTITGSWQTRTVEFTLTDEVTSGKIAIGYQASNAGSGANPMLFIDNVTIESDAAPFTDYTDHITNPSFEADNAEVKIKEGKTITGWQTSGGDDVGVYPNTNATYKTAGCDGDYVFNTWGNPFPLSVSQTTTSLPVGNYVLYVKAASDAGSHVTLFAGDQELNVVLPTPKDQFTNYPIYFTVSTEGGVIIGAKSSKSWFKVDDFRLFKLDDNTDLVPEHFETTASDWRVSGGVATLSSETPYYISKDDRYIVAQVSGVGTAIGDTKLTTLNNADEGHYPTYTWTIGGDTYFVWDTEASRFSLWYTLGDNLSLGTANTQLNNGGTVFTFDGAPSISKIYTTPSITGDLATAQAYAELTELIEAAKDLNTRLDEETTITAGIAAAEAVAASVGQPQATYSNARAALLQAIRTGLPNAGTEVDVTDIYIRNNSFETGWATPWVPNEDVAGDQNTVREAAYYDATQDKVVNTSLYMWGTDGYYVYNQWNGDYIAGSLVQNLSGLAAGEYILEAAVVGYKDKTITVYLGTESGTYVTPSANNQEGHVVTVTNTYGDNTSVQIGVTTTDTWFKADNFRLTYKPQTSVVDKTDLRRMILTAENLIKLGEGYSSNLSDLSKYIALVNRTDATQDEINSALTELGGLIKSSYEENNKNKRPTPSVLPFEEGGEYFLYNVATKSYLNFGSQWGTRAIANDYRAEAGTLLVLSHPSTLEDGRYTINTKSIWNDDTHFLVALDRDGVWIDGEKEHETTVGGETRKNTWAEMPWLFEAVPGLEGCGVYRLYRTSGDERVYGMTPGTLLKKVMTLDHMETEGDDIMISTLDADGVLNDLNSYWILVSKETRDQELEAATLANPVNASYNIKNPDLEGYDSAQLAEVWNRSTDNASVAVGGPNATSTWADCGVEIYNYANTSLSQSVTLPKIGLYRLRVNGFYRPGDRGGRGKLPDEGGSSTAYAQSISASDMQHKGLVTMNPVLYAGGESVPLMSVHIGDNSSFLKLNTDKVLYDKEGAWGYITNANFDRYNTKYYDYGHVPNEPQTGNERFRYYYDSEDEAYQQIYEETAETGLYSDNTLLVYVPEGEAVTIGVKKDGKMTNDWTLFDHFNIWYMGNEGGADNLQKLAAAYNTYRKARIDAISYIFDTYHHTELRDTAYTKFLDENGFKLQATYGSPRDPWYADDPKGTVVFAQWLQKQLEEDDAEIAKLMSGDNTLSLAETATRLETYANDLDYDVAAANLAYHMAEFYFFSRGVQTFYKALAQPGSTPLAGKKGDLFTSAKYDTDLATLQDIDTKVLNTLKKVMVGSGYVEAEVLSKEQILAYIEKIKTTYPPLSDLAINEIKAGSETKNETRDAILPNALTLAQGMNPSNRSEFDLTFLLPRADVVGLEQWDWLPIYEWLSGDNPNAEQYNYDVHTGNNKYQGHDAYFAEKWRPIGAGVDPEVWAIYQSAELPSGLYRFSAAAFAHFGGEDSQDAASNAYVAIFPATEDKPNPSVNEASFDKLYNVDLQDHSAIYKVEAEGNKTVELNMGLYVGQREDSQYASWLGMSQMRLYKIPQATISEDRVYRPRMYSDVGDLADYKVATDENSDEYKDNPYVFNFSEQAQIIGVRRSFKSGVWQSLTFPFNMTKQEFSKMIGVKPEDVVVNQFKGSKVNVYGYPDGYEWETAEDATKPEYGARIDLYFERETGDNEDYIHAHVPCIVYIKKEPKAYDAVYNSTTNQYEYYNPGTVNLVKLEKLEDAFVNPDGGDFSFDACYAGVHLSDDGNDTAGEYLPEMSYFLSGGKLMYAPRESDYQRLFGNDATYKPVKTKGLRAYFTYHGGEESVLAGNVKMMSYDFETDNGTDRIELNNFGQVVGRQINGRDVTGVYNINGQLLRKDGSSLEGLGKGVYIVNGNKVIIK